MKLLPSLKPHPLLENLSREELLPKPGERTLVFPVCGLSPEEVKLIQKKVPTRTDFRISRYEKHSVPIDSFSSVSSYASTNSKGAVGKRIVKKSKRNRNLCSMKESTCPKTENLTVTCNSQELYQKDKTNSFNEDNVSEGRKRLRSI